MTLRNKNRMSYDYGVEIVEKGFNEVIWKCSECGKEVNNKEVK